MLRQAADEDLDGVGLTDATDSLGRQDVHHPGGETAVGDHGHAASLRVLIELLLLEDDLRVAAQVGTVNPCFHRGAGHLEVEVIGCRVLHRSVTRHRRAQRGAILHVELQQGEPLPHVGLQKTVNPLRLQIRDGDLSDLGPLQEIIGAGGPLQARTQHQHAHCGKASGWKSRTI